MPPRAVLPVIVILAAALLSACTPPSAPTPAPTPTPTFSCVPEAGGEPVPCGPIEYEQAQKRDALYAEAEAVYRRYFTEYVRVYAMESPSITEVLVETTSGVFRQYLVSEFSPEKFMRQVDGAPVLVRIDRLLGVSRSGSAVALESCFDSTGAQYLRPDGTRANGVIVQERVFLAREEGVLKIVDSEAQEVEAC